jgi:hypothetical protein
MSENKENPNDPKPKRLSFDEWVKTLELKEVEVVCEECNGKGHYDCEECGGAGTVKCDKCPGAGLIEDCTWCGNAGGYSDSYPGVESTGWVVCDHCHGDPNKRCDCGGKGVVKCEEDGCEGGQIKCEECEGDGYHAEYSPRSLEHLKELRDGGVFLFVSEDDICGLYYLENAYQRVRLGEDRLIKERERLL